MIFIIYSHNYKYIDSEVKQFYSFDLQSLHTLETDYSILHLCIPKCHLSVDVDGDVLRVNPLQATYLQMSFSVLCTTTIFSQFCGIRRPLLPFSLPRQGDNLKLSSPFSISISISISICVSFQFCCSRSSPSLLWFNGFAVCSFLTIRCYFRSFTSFSRFALFVFNFFFSFCFFLSIYIFSFLPFFFILGNCLPFLSFDCKVPFVSIPKDSKLTANCGALWSKQLNI